MSNTTPDPFDSEESDHEHVPYSNPAIEVIELYGRLRQLRRALADTRQGYAVLVAACRATLSGFSFEGGDAMTNRNAHSSDNCEVTEHESSPFPSPAAEAAEFGTQLRALRRAYTNLVAACRAGLLADRDGEPDPWAYVRDELPEPPLGHPLHPHSGQDRDRGEW